MSLSAEDFNNRNRMPLTPGELKGLNERFTKGELKILRKPPWKCGSCGKKEVRVFRYVGDTHRSSEWEATCESCGEKCYT